MSESPRIRFTQKQLLRVLIAKRGWDEALFEAVAQVTLESMTQAQARRWIAQLTNETKGEAPPSLHNAVPVPAPRRRKNLSLSRSPEMRARPGSERARTSFEYVQTRISIIQQLDPPESTAAMTIDLLLHQVGIEIGLRAAALTQQIIEDSERTRDLTILERWVVYCRQLTKR